MIIRLSLRSRLRSAIAVTAMGALVASSILPAGAQVYRPAPIPGAMPASAAPGAEQRPGWPREIPADGLRLLMYQPQIEAWDSHQLRSKAAIAVGEGASGDTSYGVAYFSARTEIDKSSRQVFLHDVRIERVTMPGAPHLAGPVRAALENRWAGATRTLSLDRLQASLAASQAQAGMQQAIEVDNTPPRILFSTIPAVLVLVDGEPVLQPVVNTRFERVVNTNALLLRHSTTGRFYLRVAGLWAGAASPQGPWVIERAGLYELDRIKAAALAEGRVDILDDDDQPGPYGWLPDIHVGFAPAELLQTEGEPQYAPIGNTRLLFVANTVSDIFVDTPSREFYVLISGRWFRSPSLGGPWAYVDSGELPGDFRLIPETHAKGDVLASIAGTPQAAEAAIANSIPQTATIDREAAQFQAVYDGDPQFQPVEGTALYYAANAPVPVIRVDPATYYAVYDGVWFTAPTPNGPWVVAYVVPPAIYAIPPRSPIYYATYVRIYGYSPRYVHVGYTPGYYGTYVTRRGTVVYGSGYRYRPWIGRAYYPRPASYGYGAGFVAGGFTGFILGLATAAIVSAPYWGPHWSSHDRDRRDRDRRDWDRRSYSSNAYRQWEGRGAQRSSAPAPTSSPQAARPAPTAQAAPAPAAPAQAASVEQRQRRIEAMRRESQAYRDTAARNRVSAQPTRQTAPATATVAPSPTPAPAPSVSRVAPTPTPTPAPVSPAPRRNDVFVGPDNRVYRPGEQGWQRLDRDTPRAAPDKAALEKAAKEKASRDKAAQEKAAQDKAAQEKSRREAEERARQQARPPSAQPAPQAAVKPVAPPVAPLAVQPAPKPAPQAAAKPAPQPAPQAAAKPAPQAAPAPAPKPAPQAAVKPAPAPTAPPSRPQVQARPQPPAPPARAETQKKLDQEKAARAAGEAQTDANRGRPAPDAFVPPERGKRNGRGN